MKNTTYLIILVFVGALTLLGCKIEEKSGNGFVPNGDYIDLGSIPAQFKFLVFQKMDFHLAAST